MEKYVFPHLGTRPIGEIEPQDVLDVLRKLEDKDLIETARRVRSLLSRIFKSAVVDRLCKSDPAGVLDDALAKGKGKATTGFAALYDPKEVGELLRKIDSYHGQPSMMFALRLAPLVFVRPGELRYARWSQFDFDAKEWRIPARQMKEKRMHIVPLSRQAIEILEELKLFTGDGDLLFPGLRSRRDDVQPISENSLNVALHRMGYKGRQTSHGLRTVASTLLNELGFSSDAIELQLSHLSNDKVRRAYNKSQLLPERRKMMQAWADYLDQLKCGATVTYIAKPA